MAKVSIDTSNLTNAQYALLGRTVYAIIRDEENRIGNDHTGFRLAITLAALDFIMQEACPLSSRVLNRLTHIAVSRTIPAGERLEEKGIIWVEDRGPNNAKIFHFKKEAFPIETDFPLLLKSFSFSMEGVGDVKVNITVEKEMQ